MKASTAVLAVAMCAMLALACAAEAEKPYVDAQGHGHEREYYEHEPRGDYEHRSDYEQKYKAFTLYAGPGTSCNGNAINCTEAVSLTRVLYADSAATTLPVATLYQTGLVAATGTNLATTRVLYWQSFRFTGLNGFGEGTIQTQGDDTGFNDPTFTNRAITGGTGVFTGVLGYVTRGGNPATTNPGPYTFVLTRWSKDSDYGSYYDGKGY